jgi:hypothetical protein
MMKLFLTLTALLLVPMAALRSAEPPLVLILSGQSNMVGVGQAGQLSPEWRTPPANVTLMNWGRPQPLATGRIGPEVTLAHALARAMPGRQIVLFKAAHGGTLARPATIPRARAAETGQKRIPIIQTKRKRLKCSGDTTLPQARKKEIPLI